MSINATDILAATAKVTKDWTKQRKAEERSSRAYHNRQYIYSGRVYLTDVAAKILPGGYLHASGDGRYTVSKRNLFYAVREQFKQKTGRELEWKHFVNTILVQFINRNPEITNPWKLTADPRGTLIIPNTSKPTRVPCGTIAIGNYLREHGDEVVGDPFGKLDSSLLPIEWPSLAAGQRFQAVLYIEKEGFDAMLQEANIAGRFNIAILSCKGQSVVAARKFVDHVCRENGGVPLFVVHDFDKSGFEISQCLTTVSESAREKDLVQYEFQNEINVTDLGLRLPDVEKYHLQSETVRFKGYFPFDSIATAEEQAFLRSGRRVELNAFTAPQFIEWIETKLTQAGLDKPFIPHDEVVEAAYRSALATAKINKALKDAQSQAVESAKEAKLSKAARRRLSKLVKEENLPWDKALYAIAEKTLVSHGDES
jgi:hypothetical protein